MKHPRLLLLLPLLALCAFNGAPLCPAKGYTAARSHLPTFSPSRLLTPRPGKDFALFFAVNHYNAWEKLKNPIAEAEAIAKDLHDLYGFDTLVVRNPTKAEIQAKIDAFRARTYADDAQLLLFFTGHGEYLENTREGFFIPKDAKRDDPSQDSYLPYLRLQRWVETLPCRHILLCIDACFSGTFDDDIALKGGPGKRPGETGDWREQYIRQSLQYRSRLFMASGAKVRTPDKSAFAQQFLLALRSFGGDDRLLSSTELWGYVQRANPKPCAARFGDHEAGGDFLLVLQNDPSPTTNTDLADWNAAKASHTVAAYEIYLQKHPQGDFVEAANGKIAVLPAMPDKMVRIAGGTFEMGSEEGGGDEKPVHRVTVNDFYMSKYEVTVAEYLKFCNETNTHFPEWMEKGSKYNTITGTDDHYKKLGGALTAPNHPIVGVSWEDAVAYCKWLSQKNGLHYRLSTEAEWEYAARGGTVSRKTRYAGSNNLDEVAWHNANADAKTHPTEEKKSNELGLYDMSGNVREWCSDWYGSDYYKNSPASNPVGPSTGSSRVCRGGSWGDGPASCRVAYRYYGTPGYRSSILGFRLARTN